MASKRHREPSSRGFRLAAPALLAWAALGFASPALATENGLNPFPNGLNGTEVGNLPPKGLYVVNEFLYISADRFNDSNGDKAFPDFKLDVAAYAPRFLWNTGSKVLGGEVAFQFIEPLVYTDLDNPPPPPVPEVPPFGSKKLFYAGDPILSALVAWHGKKVHVIAGSDFVIPLGEYKRNELVNAGLNRFTISPAIALSYYPSDRWEVSGKATYDIYFKNKKTGYDSGNAFLLDYAINRHIPIKSGKILVGVSGYLFHQLSDDTVSGVRFRDGFRGHAFGIGPAITYQNSKGPRVELKLQKDMDVENRAQGVRAFLRAFVKLR
jgi:hypothetical protein